MLRGFTDGRSIALASPHGRSGIFIAVYILASQRHGTLYIGVTSDLISRVAQHKNGEFEGFTKKYGVTRLVWFEAHDSIVEAIGREKHLKKYRRDWKINLIERENPEWNDLFPGLLAP